MRLSRILAMLLCICVAYAAGLTVFRELSSVFKGWIGPAAGGVSFIIVFSVLYFPLAKPVADAIGEKISTFFHRGKHIKSGSGIEDIPDAPIIPPCSICGDPNGPICKECETKMSGPPRTSKIDLNI